MTRFILSASFHFKISILISFSVFFSVFALPLKASSQEAQVKSLQVLHEQEIAVIAESNQSIPNASKNWKACIPQESQKFPDTLSKELSEKIFSPKEFKDLKACKPGACKHNFLPYEIELLAKINDENKLKEQFFRFYQNRVSGLTPIDPRNQNLKFSTVKDLAPFCIIEDLNQLIQKRPLAHAEYRLSHVQYDTRMRPTTRLVQAITFKTKDGWTCHAEALIFSNHYDLDRIEIWGLDPNAKLHLVIRHRIDLLNSWWRRLQKSKLQDALELAASRQMKSALQCLENG